MLGMKSWFKNDRPSEVAFVAPMSGELLTLDNIPDPAFQYMGKGIAINPTLGEVVSPVEGKITVIFPTKHAIGINTPDGAEVLIHIGINTVDMKGEGFTTHVDVGDKVKAGQQLVSFSLDLVQRKATSSITSVIVTNPEHCGILEITQDTTAEIGKTVIMSMNQSA